MSTRKSAQTAIELLPVDWGYMRKPLRAMPLKVSSLYPCSIATTNTVLLLISGVTLTWAHTGFIAGAQEAASQGLFHTLFYALLFMFFQYIEYKYSSLHMNDSVFGSIFFMITGFHGFHVLIGTVFIFTCCLRTWPPDRVTFTRQQHFGFLASLWYWHFVDVIWLFVFFILYVWGSWGSWDLHQQRAISIWLIKPHMHHILYYFLVVLYAEIQFRES